MFNIFKFEHYSKAFWSFFYIFDLVFFALKSPLRIGRQWSHENFAILSVDPQSHVKILI